MEEELYLQSSGVAATCPPGLAGSLNICNKMHKHDNKWNVDVETHEQRYPDTNGGMPHISGSKISPDYKFTHEI